MPYDEDSAEAAAGRRGEAAVDEWLRVHYGYSRIRVSMLGNKAVFELPDGTTRAAYDRLYFNLGSRWTDIKWKRGPVHLRRVDVLRHGVDLPAFENYIELSRLSQIGGDIAIIELKRHRNSNELAPLLLIQSVRNLYDWKGAMKVCDYPTEDFPYGGVFWDRAAFKILGPIGIGTVPLPPTRLNLHPWEMRDRWGELRMPPDRPRQSDLFEETNWSIPCGV